MRFGFLIFLLLVLTACESEDLPTSFSAVSIGGVYVGATMVDGTVRDYTFTIPATSRGSFTWSGTVDSEEFPETLPVGGTGAYDYPDITFTETTRDEPTMIRGTVNTTGDTITLEGDENGQPVTLVLRRSS